MGHRHHRGSRSGQRGRLQHRGRREKGRKHITVALAGNANVGKSVIFNELTGLHQHVGNSPGRPSSGRRERARGEGQVWRRQRDNEEIVNVIAGACLTIPLGTNFQLRNTGSEPLRFVIATMPPWPGEGEVEMVEGRWRPMC